VLYVSSAVLVALIAGLAIYFIARWKRMARYGRFDIPCDEVVQLPAGEVTLSYGDSRGVRYAEAFEPPPTFSVTLSDEQGGKRIEPGEPESMVSTKTGGGRSRVPYATFQLPRAGSYRLNVRINEGDEIIDPHVGLG
jgi:hypothetical protein